MQQPLPCGCVKLCEIQVIAATAVGATISWLRQYLGEFWGPHTLEAVIFLEAHKLSVFECFFWWWTPILWESDCLIEIFLCFSYTRKWRAICISGNSHTHTVLPKTPRGVLKPSKSYCRDLLLPHFGLPGFFPPSLLGQVSGRYRGFTASWLWVAYYWKSEGGGWVGCWTKKCWLEPRRNPRIHGEKWFLWRGTMIGSNLIVSRWNYTLQYKQRNVSTGKQKQNNKERQFTMWLFWGGTVLSFYSSIPRTNPTFLGGNFFLEFQKVPQRIHPFTFCRPIWPAGCINGRRRCQLSLGFGSGKQGAKPDKWVANLQMLNLSSRSYARILRWQKAANSERRLKILNGLSMCSSGCNGGAFGRLAFGHPVSWLFVWAQLQRCIVLPDIWSLNKWRGLLGEVWYGCSCHVSLPQGNCRDWIETFRRFHLVEVRNLKQRRISSHKKQMKESILKFHL